MITTDRYRGARAFSGDIEQVKRDLQKVPEELDRAFQQQSRGLARRWLMTAVALSVAGATVNVAAAFDTMTRVNSAPGGTVNVLLPAFDPQRIGSELAIQRRSTAGTVVALPPVGTLVNGATSVTLAATVGYYVFVLDDGGYYKAA